MSRTLGRGSRSLGCRSLLLSAPTGSTLPHPALPFPALPLPFTIRLTSPLFLTTVYSSPSNLTVLPPAWGAGLASGIAGEYATLYVRMRPEGDTVPGSALSRRLMHSISVEALEADSREVAVVNMRMVHVGESNGVGTGEVAEVTLLCATASDRWTLRIAVNGRPVFGSPVRRRRSLVTACVRRSRSNPL